MVDPLPSPMISRRTLLAGGMASLLFDVSLHAEQANYDWQPAKLAPGVTFDFIDRRGKPVSLAAFHGKPVLLNLWATWCIPCVIELPALDRLQRDMKDRLAVVALSVDRTGLEAVRMAWRKLSIRHLDGYADPDGAVARKLDIPSLPATLAVSASGAPVSFRRGRVDWDDAAERERLRTILKL